MSEILTYLTEKAATPKEWLRRKPRETHPAILAAVRDAEAAGLVYNDDVERRVAEVAGDLPPHRWHGDLDRDPIISQLSSEVYLAHGILKDETARAEQNRLLAEGFTPIRDVQIRHGGRYEVCLGVLYSGYEVPNYSQPNPVRAYVSGGRIVFLPKGARLRGFASNNLTLVKPIAD